MASESRSTDPGGRIRRVMFFLLLAAARRWQAVLYVMLMKACISPNKVRKGSYGLGCSGQPWIRSVLGLLAVLRRLEFPMKHRLDGFHKTESLLSYCIFFGFVHLVWWRKVRSSGISGAEELELLCRSGSEDKQRLFGSEVLRGISLTANCGDHQRRRLCVSAIHGRRGRSVPWRSFSHGVIYLQAGVPMRRPFFSSAVASNVAPSSSGFVPGDGADGRRDELLDFGGQGSNCFFTSVGKVLYVKFRDLVVIFFSFEVHDVMCNSTD